MKHCGDKVIRYAATVLGLFVMTYLLLYYANYIKLCFKHKSLCFINHSLQLKRIQRIIQTVQNNFCQLIALTINCIHNVF